MNNQEFKRFKLIVDPLDMFLDRTKCVDLWCIGLRKDGKFIVEDSNGNKKLISNYEEKRYLLPDKSDVDVLNEFIKCKSNNDIVRSQLTAKEREIASRLKNFTLEDFRQELSK